MIAPHNAPVQASTNSGRDAALEFPETVEGAPGNSSGFFPPGWPDYLARQLRKAQAENDRLTERLIAEHDRAYAERLEYDAHVAQLESELRQARAEVTELLRDLVDVNIALQVTARAADYWAEASRLWRNDCVQLLAALKEARPK